MIPNRELQELAQAVKRSSEYTDIVQLRRRIMEHPRLGRLMAMFERENARIYSLGPQHADIEQMLKKLYADYKDFLGEAEVKKYVETMRAYQKMIGDCISYLNKNLDISRAY